VVFAIDRAGLVGDDGQTHQGIFDVGMFLQMPNMRVFCPAGITEMRRILQFAIQELNCPVAIRYPRGGSDAFSSDITSYEPVSLRDGDDVAIITYGRLVENAMDAAKLLDKHKVSVRVIKLTEISNISCDILSNCLDGIGQVFIVEECVSNGSVASSLALLFSENDIDINITAINLGSGVVPHASVEQLFHIYNLDAEGITKKVLSTAKNQKKTLKLTG